MIDQIQALKERFEGRRPVTVDDLTRLQKKANGQFIVSMVNDQIRVDCSKFDALVSFRAAVKSEAYEATPIRKKIGNAFFLITAKAL